MLSNSPTDTGRLVSLLIDAWNRHEPDAVAELVTPDYEGVDVAEEVVHLGPEGVRDLVCRYFLAFPDLRLECTGIVAQEDQVAVEWTAQGTHSGKLMGIPPTGKRVTVRGVMMLSLQDGLIRRALHIWDVAGLLRSLGLLPDLARL